MSNQASSLISATTDFARHIERLRHLPDHSHEELRTFFKRNLSIHVARAPGRLDVMGGIGDYSGSLVLEMPTAEAAFVAVQPSRDGTIRILSISQTESTVARVFHLSASDFARYKKADYDAIRNELRRENDSSWAAYVLGPLFVLLKATGAKLSGGFRILVDSQVPEGKGVSSSAAIEVATIRALAALLQLELPAEELARLCQVAENQIVGAPCGIMDQMTSALGRANSLLALRCQPAIVEDFVPIPPEVSFWGIDSGIRHAVIGSDYTSVRCGAFMGYRIVADIAGLSAMSSVGNRQQLAIHDLKWRGYLANITIDEFDCKYRRLIPERMVGQDFLCKYAGTTDLITQVEPTRTYDVFSPTIHPIEENVRAERFRALLQQPVTPATLTEMGDLMTAAHASYSACGIGSGGTDLLADLVRQAGPANGLYGAKITGGGSGGSVAILGDSGAELSVEQIAQQYTAATGRSANVFRGSSPGAFGTPVAEVII